ncbi:YagK/YfjJ domain-containing protein [Jejubacter calystegiae]
MMEELDAMQRTYSRVFVARFDLRLPSGTAVETGNEWIRQLFKKLRERLKSKHRRPESITSPIREFAYGWVREKEKAKQVHYHCWIALPHRQVRSIGTANCGLGGAITEVWCDLTGGKPSLVEFPGGEYIILRGEPETLEEPVWRISYLAKERGKFSTGQGDRLFSTSKLRHKYPNT